MEKYRRVTIGVVLFQLLMTFCLLTIDLYVFRGYYSSKIYIHDGWNHEQNYSCELKIEKTSNDKYLFTFRNNSIFPQYFVNYRNEERRQKITDTLFFNYLDGNLFPAYGFDYYLSFDCGTGLGMSSINPFENFEIEKSYQEIINEFSHINKIKKTELFNSKIKKSYDKLSYEEIDSLIVQESQLVSITDSIQVEYYVDMNTFFTKNKVYTLSNKINVSLKDLLNQYVKRRVSKEGK